jgi:hypothetical protein
MANQVLFSILNSVPFYWVERPVPSGKNQFFMGEDWYVNQIPSWYSKSKYSQPYQKSDNVYIQLQSNMGVHNISLVSCSTKLAQKAATFTQITTIPTPAPMPRNYFEVLIQLADVPEGEYYFLIKSGTGNTIITHVSEPISIKLQHIETVQVQYKGAGDDLDVWFDGSQIFTLRVEGRLNTYAPGAVFKTYQDQILNTVQLSSVPYDQYKFTVGGSFGIPNWMLKKLNALLSYDTVIVEGLQIVKADGSKFDVTRVDRYGLIGASIDVQPALNKTYDLADSSYNNRVNVVYNLDATMFGTFNDLPGNNIIQITDVN